MATAELPENGDVHLGGRWPCRPVADILALTEWQAFSDRGLEPNNGLWIGAVLRSWEDRFGARLLWIGPGAEIRLLVDRPPRTFEATAQVANEHWAFADEFNGQGRTSIHDLAIALIEAPVWRFCWD
jgi:hypothetical protein